jgi:hypothetical protein
VIAEARSRRIEGESAGDRGDLPAPAASLRRSALASKEIVSTRTRLSEEPAFAA